MKDILFLNSCFSKSTKMVDKINEFIYNRSFQKRPKKLQNNVFVVYSLRSIKLWPGELINVDMKLLVCMPEQTIAACILWPTLGKDWLKLESF